MTNTPPHDAPMRRDFTDRADLIDYLRAQFPTAEPTVSETRGGRAAAEAQLQQIDPIRYERTRNWLDGAVTRLSMYIRYGVLDLAEVRDAALAKVAMAEHAEKLLNELGVRDYWQRVYAEIGEGVWQDREEHKTGWRAVDYSDTLPQDIRTASTGMACVDAWVRELYATGYIHNHARMWLASYVIHWRRVRWQVGAAWFLEHLLDGDPASNNLSWQWVAGTFSAKPYLANRQNVEKYTSEVYCKACPLYRRCDFEGSYEDLDYRLFPRKDRPDDHKSWRPPKNKRRKQGGQSE
jgi:deoxyribodipyrimidine photo-lyase